MVASRGRCGPDEVAAARRAAFARFRETSKLAWRRPESVGETDEATRDPAAATAGSVRRTTPALGSTTPDLGRDQIPEGVSMTKRDRAAETTCSCIEWRNAS